MKTEMRQKNEASVAVMMETNDKSTPEWCASEEGSVPT